MRINKALKCLKKSLLLERCAPSRPPCITAVGFTPSAAAMRSLYLSSAGSHGGWEPRNLCTRKCFGDLLSLASHLALWLSLHPSPLPPCPLLFSQSPVLPPSLSLCCTSSSFGLPWRSTGRQLLIWSCYGLLLDALAAVKPAL